MYLDVNSFTGALIPTINSLLSLGPRIVGGAANPTSHPSSARN